MQIARIRGDRGVSHCAAPAEKVDKALTGWQNGDDFVRNRGLASIYGSPYFPMAATPSVRQGLNAGRQFFRPKRVRFVRQLYPVQ